MLYFQYFQTIFFFAFLQIFLPPKNSFFPHITIHLFIFCIFVLRFNFSLNIDLNDILF